MADETPNVEEQEDAGTPAAEEAPRRRGRGASAQQPAEGCLDPVVGLLVQSDFGDHSAPGQAPPEF